MYKTILVPTDGTTLSDKAITAAIQYAIIHKECKVIGMTVAELQPLSQFSAFNKSNECDYSARENQLAQERINKFVEQAKAANIPFETVILQSSKPHEEIIRASTMYKCDCIFMASNGRKGLNKLFIGSETQKVLAMASIPVLVYR